MKKPIKLRPTHILLLTLAACFVSSCSKPSVSNTPNTAPTTTSPPSPSATLFTSAEVQAAAKKATDSIQATTADNLTLKNWASELMVADPVALDIDDMGNVYFTRTHRQKNSEFDIRGHRDWEFDSVLLQSVEDKRAFLHKTLSSENSEHNSWMRDMNADGSHDWRDMLIEKEQVYRLSDTNKDGLADSSLLVLDDFNDETTDVAGALLVHNEQLFVGVGPDMWRLRDSNNDGVMDQKESIAHGFGVHVGFSGHGMSGGEVGPDGRIYWGIGDIGFSGKGRDDNGKHWHYPNRGVIVRANPDGTDFEVFAMGVRNTHEFVFDEYGNLISVDNDGDHAGESERIVYLPEGSDTGWRINWQLGKYRDPLNNSYKVWMDEDMYTPWFKDQPAHIVPAIANYVNGPTGMVYNPGTALSEKWKNTFFVAEFIGDPLRSGIHAFQLSPKGAGFELKNTQKIISGVLATGMDFGPDGSLYIADWIDGWKTKDAGRIWQLDDSSGAHSTLRNETAQLLPQDFSVFDSSTLANLLAHADMRVRQKAQLTLVEHKPNAAEVLQTTLANSNQQFARIHSIWGLAQLARQTPQHAEMLTPYLQDDDPEIRAQSARWLGDIRYTPAAPSILPLLNDSYPRARFFAAEALGRIAHAPASSGLISLLRKNGDDDAYIRHAASLALARIGNDDALAALSTDPNEALRVAALVALRRMQSVKASVFLNDSSERVLAEAARAIHDDASIEGALPQLGDFLLQYQGTNEAIIRRAISANLRTASRRSLQNLLAYSQQQNAPKRMREEAIAALGSWTKPSIFDRVDGQYRGHIARANDEVSQYAEAVLSAHTRDKSAAIRAASIRALGQLDIQAAGTVIFAALKKDTASSVRIAAIDALAQLNSPQLDSALSLGLKDASSSVRSRALDLLSQSPLEHTLIADLLEGVLQTGRIDEKQAALSTLGKLSVESAKPLMTQLLDDFAKRNLPDAIVLDLREAVQATKDQDLLSALEQATARYADTPLETQYAGLLEGGNADKGRNIFRWHQSAQCLKCHALSDDKPKAGPSLGQIGATLSKAQILEALVEPSKRIAPGFGQGPSSMPNMRYFLSERELRDLVSYLSNLTSY